MQRDWAAGREVRTRSGEVVSPCEDVYPDLGWVWDGYTTLSQTRRVDGMAGAQAISVLEIEAYTRMHDIRGERAAEFADLVLAMDREFMTWTQAQIAKRRSRETDAGRSTSSRAHSSPASR